MDGNTDAKRTGNADDFAAPIYGSGCEGNDARIEYEDSETGDLHVIRGEVYTAADSLATLTTWVQDDESADIFRIEVQGEQMVYHSDEQADDAREDGEVAGHLIDARYGDAAAVKAGDKEGLTSDDIFRAFDDGARVRVQAAGETIVGTMTSAFMATIEADDGEEYTIKTTIPGSNPTLWRKTDATGRERVGNITHLSRVVFVDEEE